MSKITRTTIKSFIARNKNGLYIKTKSDFDAMQDCVTGRESEFTKIKESPLEANNEYTLGINGAWFVGRSRDYFEPYADDHMVGYEVSNCCGSFILAFQK